MATLTLSDVELNILKDSLANERLNFSDEIEKNPDLEEHVKAIVILEEKLNET